MEANISLEYPTAEIAKSIMKALQPDNELTNSKMQISTQVRGSRLNVTIKGCKRIETLQSTVQDIFRCLRAAEESLTRTSSIARSHRI